MAKKNQAEDPAQLTMAVFCPPIVTATGDGTFTVKPGRPITRVTPEQLGSRFAVDRDTIYRWRQEGTIPEKFVIFGGKRKLLFDAEVISHLEDTFKKLRE